MDDLIKYGEVRRGTVPGIRVQPLTTQLAQRLGVTTTRGALVYSVDQRSEAFRAGIVAGDIIVSFNGSPVEDMSQFIRMLSDAPGGSPLTLAVLHPGGRHATIKVAVAQASGRATRRRSTPSRSA